MIHFQLSFELHVESQMFPEVKFLGQRSKQLENFEIEFDSARIELDQLTWSSQTRRGNQDTIVMTEISYT